MEEVGLNQNLPQHVAIVMDGNGRWAERQHLPRVEGHRAGMDAVKAVIECCLRNKIYCLSLFAFSSENWSRPEIEVDFLMQLFLTALEQEIKSLHEQGVRVRFIGDRFRLSEKLRRQMQSAETLTQMNTTLILNLAVNYSGKWDILNAVNHIISDVIHKGLCTEEINELTFNNYLSTHELPEPDLLIRTGKEQRISNFFLWQLAYTELYFSKAYWPDFTKEEFEDALKSYGLRERRFGLISSQLNEKDDV